MRNGSFRTVKRAVSGSETARFAPRYGSYAKTRPHGLFVVAYIQVKAVGLFRFCLSVVCEVGRSVVVGSWLLECDDYTQESEV